MQKKFSCDRIIIASSLAEEIIIFKEEGKVFLKYI